MQNGEMQQFMGQQMQGQGLPPLQQQQLQQQQQQQQQQLQLPPARQLINMAQVNPLLVGQGPEVPPQNGSSNPNQDPQRGKGAQLARGGSITSRLGGGGVGGGNMTLQTSAPQVQQSSMQMQGLMQNQQHMQNQLSSRW